MIGRGGQGRGCGGHGRRIGRGFRGRGRGNCHYTATLNKNKGLCSALGNNIFDYSQKGESDQMRTAWENIFHHFGTIYGPDIRNEPQNKMRVFIPNPEYTEDIHSKQKRRVEILNLQSARLSEAREAKRSILTQAVEGDNYLDVLIKMAMLENEIDEAMYKDSINLEVQLMDAEKTEHYSASHIYI